MNVSSPEIRPALSASEGAGPLAKPDSDTVLEVKGLVKEYPGTRALDGVDLQIHRGEIHALLGENGAGKSTLIRLICGATRPEQVTENVRAASWKLTSDELAEVDKLTRH